MAGHPDGNVPCAAGGGVQRGPGGGHPVGDDVHIALRAVGQPGVVAEQGVPNAPPVEILEIRAQKPAVRGVRVGFVHEQEG